MIMNRVLLYFAIKYQGNYDKILNAIKSKEQIKQCDLLEVESSIKCQYLTLLDPNYPSYLKAIGTPPFVLFYYGDITLLNAPNKVACIGKRENSKYGEEMCKKIVDGLKKYNACVVSGMANGIDSIAHNEALNNNMKTIAVLGGGIDYIYPSKNKELYEKIKKDGLILSEYPNDMPPVPQNFLIRNRLIAALSDYIVVMEANYKSGTMNTIGYGLDFGKDICAVPTNANIESGTNLLIKEGAKLVECAKDIYE